MSEHRRHRRTTRFVALGALAWLLAACVAVVERPPDSGPRPPPRPAPPPVRDIGTLSVWGPNVTVNGRRAFDGMGIRGHDRIETGRRSNAQVDFRGGGFVLLAENSRAAVDFEGRGRRRARGHDCAIEMRRTDGVTGGIGGPCRIDVGTKGLAADGLTAYLLRADRREAVLTVLDGRARLTRPARIDLQPGERIRTEGRDLLGPRPISRREYRRIMGWLQGPASARTALPPPAVADLAIPNLRGMRLAEARRVIRRSGFRLGQVSERPSGKAPPGAVLRQQPKPGRSLAEGAAIDLVVAVEPLRARPPGTPPGPPPPPDVRPEPDRTAAPALTGLPFDKARRVLDRARIRLGEVTRETTRQAAAGTVIRQQPPAGTPIGRRGRVDLVLAQAPEKRPPGKPVMADLTGLTLAAARDRLAEAKLRLGRVTEQVRTDTEPGTVIAQRPKPDASIKRGVKVDLVVARAPAAEVPPAAIAVPNLAGLSEQAARRTLSGAGLSLGRIAKKLVTGAARAGKVVAQSPAAGTEVEPGSTVDLTVSAPLQPK